MADPSAKDYYAVVSEALLFAYLQRDEAKIAKRLAQMDKVLTMWPELRCPVHAVKSADNSHMTSVRERLAS